MAVAAEQTAPSPKVSLITVDIADLAVTSRPQDVLVTYSLGSCVGVTLYDPLGGIGGMIHCMLPLSMIEPDKAAARPYLFVDTGVTALIDRMIKAGALRENLVAKVAGCAAPMGREGNFSIGKRNHTVLRKLLWKNDIIIENEMTGGSSAMTMYLRMSTGETCVKVGGKEVLL